MGLDPAALGPADALLLGSNWELPVHWCVWTSGAVAGRLPL